MKKLICLIFGIMAISILMSTSVFAGDVPEALGYEDSAQVFIGTLKDFDADNSENSKVLNATVLPTIKIKGDVPIDQLKTYELCYFGRVTPEKEAEYLFGWFADNSVWVFAIDSYNENEIKLKITDDFAKRIQDYLDDGLYKRLEQERSTIGKELSFLEYLYKKPSFSSSGIEKVTFRYQDNLYDVDKDKFFQIAEDIMITNVKNDTLQDAKPHSSIADAYKTVLYIELLDINNQTIYYCAVSRFGEVDRYGVFMSRLMAKDYEMKRDDLSKLYSLLPEDVQNGIASDDVFNNLSEEPKTYPKNNYIGIVLGVIFLVLIVFSIVFLILRKKRK